VVSKEHIADAEALMRHWGYRYVESATWLWQAPTNRLEAQPAPLFRRSHSTLIIGRRGAWDVQSRSLIASICVFSPASSPPTSGLQSLGMMGARGCHQVIEQPIEQRVDHEHICHHAMQNSAERAEPVQAPGLWSYVTSATRTSSSRRAAPPANYPTGVLRRPAQEFTHTTLAQLDRAQRAHTHTHSTETTHTKRPTHTGLTHSSAGNALPMHTSRLAYKYRQGMVVLL